MRKPFLAIITIAIASIAPAQADQLSVDAPLLDRKDSAVNQQIFDLEKNGVLSNTEAAALQARRGNIMREADVRRKRNNGILPTADLRELSNRMEAISRHVGRRIAARSNTNIQ